MIEYLFTKTPLAFFVQNLWRDEAFTFLLSKQSIGELLQTTAADFNPPLFYVFMHYWMLIFGSSEIAMRTVSLLFYVLTIFIMFEIMVLVFKISFKRALLYFILIIANPVLLTYAFEARMYMMGAFFVTLSYFALWTGRKKLYIFAVVLALHTHYFTLLVFTAQMISEIIQIITSHHWKASLKKLDLTLSGFRKKPSHYFKLIRSLIVSDLVSKLIIICICLIPWMLFLLAYHDFSSTVFWIIKPLGQDVLFLPLVLFTGYQRVFGQYYHDQAGYASFHAYLNILIWGVLLLPWIVLTVKIVRSVIMKKTRSIVKIAKNYILFNYHLPLVLWAVFPPVVLYIISQFSTPVYHPRYFMFSVVGGLLYMIQIIETIFPPQKHILKLRLPFSISQIISPLGSFIGKNLLMILTVVILLLFTNQYNILNLKYNAKRTISPMFQEINRSMRAGDRVYLTRELDYFLAKYYLKNDAIYIFGVPYEDIHAYVGKVLIPPSSIMSSGIPTYPARAFFVYYDRFVVRSEM